MRLIFISEECLMRKLATVLLFVWFVLAAEQQLDAQSYVYATGIPSFSTQIPIENGVINVNNGEIHIEIPLATHAQRGRLQLNESLVYDSRIWQIVNNGGTYQFQPTNVPDSMGGWRLSSTAPTAPTYSSYIDRYGSCGSGQEQLPTEEQFSNFAWTDPQGTNHAFATGFYQELPIPCDTNQQPAGGAGYALDGSGYYMTMTYDPDTLGVDTVVYDRQGNQVYPALQDPNGNYMSTDGNGNLVDTLGRTPVLTSTNGNQIYYDVLSNGGARLRYTVTTETINYSTAFFQPDVLDNYGSFTAIQSIQLPDGSSYSFTYDSYGELNGVTLPTGGSIQYSYQLFIDSFSNYNRWLYQRIKDGGTTTFTPEVATLCTSDIGCQEATKVTSPDGNDTVYSFTLDPGAVSNGSSWNTRIAAYQGAVSLSTHGHLPLKTVTTTYTYGTTNMELTTGTVSYTVPQTETVVTSLPDVGLTSQTVTTLDSIGANPTNVQLWDYYSGTAPSTPTKQGNYTYGYSVNGANLLTQISITDGNGNPASQTTYNYDQTAPIATSGLPNHNSVSEPEGNLTSMSLWLNTAPGNPITTTYTVDDSGMVTAVKDPNGNSSGITYQCSNALPLQATNALSQTTTYGYDCNSGAITSVKDPNDSATGRAGTTYQYDDDGRLQTITSSDGGQTTYSYPSVGEVDTSVLATPNPTITSQDIADSFGRPYQHVQAGASSETTYDANGRVSCVTNPHFSTPSSTDGTTCVTTYDGLNRPTIETEPDGNKLTWSYSGNTVTSTDEVGNSWQRTSDAFGELANVLEPGNLQTGYSHNALGNLSSVTQYGTTTDTPRIRSFTYDSLSRLICASNPENSQNACPASAATPLPSGVVSYSYYPNGNVNSKTDARGITTSYSYDALNRLTGKTYSDSTPPVVYNYDEHQPSWLGAYYLINTIGRLSSASVGGQNVYSQYAYSYDAVGRLYNKFVMEPDGTGNTLSSGVGNNGDNFDLAGNIAFHSEDIGTYLSQTRNAAGQVTDVTSDFNTTAQLNDVWSYNIFTNATYTAFGAPSTRVLGNGLTETRTYDNRLRVTSITQSQPGSTFGYSVALGYYNNGNVEWSNDSVNGNWVYQYDSLNRLTGATSANGLTLTWTYDSFGNRLSQSASGTGYAPQVSFSFTGNNNQMGAGSAIYDTAGNVTFDGDVYSYDAEGRVTSFANKMSQATYKYDPEGELVYESGDAGVQIFQRNSAGRPLFIHAPSGGVVPYYNNFAYIDGELIGSWQNRAFYWAAKDWLGTKRYESQGVGDGATAAPQLPNSYTSLPFGDNLNSLGTDPLHFTGLERDLESGLDHTTFRQYSSTTGRWMSPDPYMGSMDINYPQTLNRYAYVNNSPLTSIDPTGLDGEGTSPFPSPFQLIYDIMSIFTGPSFHGSLQPRPSVQDPWNEHIGLPAGAPLPGGGIWNALGLPSGGCEFGACGGGPTSFQSAAAAAPIPAAVCAVAEPCGVAAVAVTGVVAGGIIAYENKDAIKGSWTALADSFLKNYNNLQNENNNRCAVVKQAAIASCSAQFVGRGLSESPVLTRACVRIQMTAQGCFNY